MSDGTTQGHSEPLPADQKLSNRKRSSKPQPLHHYPIIPIAKYHEDARKNDETAKAENLYEFNVMLAHSQFLARFMLFVVMSDALCVTLHQDLSLPALLCDSLLAVYSFAFCVKLYSDRKKYWFNAHNVFDFLMIFLSIVDFLLLRMTSWYTKRNTDLMRSFRAIRALKYVNYLPGIQVIANALIRTLKQLFSDVILLLVLIIYVFGVMGFYIFGYQAIADSVIQAWGTLAATFLTLFTVMTADSWWKFITDLVEGGNSPKISYPFILAFLFVGHFIILNLVVAVIITNIQSSSDDYKFKKHLEREIQVAHRKRQYWKRSRSEVKNMVNQVTLNGESNFSTIATDFYHAFRKHDFLVMSDLKSNILWIETFSRNMNRSLRYSKSLLLHHREIMTSVGPLCNWSVKDSRKSSISQNYRYFIEQEEGSLVQLLKVLAPLD